MVDRAWMAYRSRDGSVAITVSVLEKCLDRVALLITESGDKGAVYLPVYDRLEAELEALKGSPASRPSLAVHAAREAKMTDVRCGRCAAGGFSSV
jgi:hypothetical protein